MNSRKTVTNEGSTPRGKRNRLYPSDGVRRRMWIGLLEDAHALRQADARRDGRKPAANLIGVFGDGFEHHGTPAQMEFKLLRLPFGRAHLYALHAEPAALVEPPQQSETEIDVLGQMTLEPRQPLHPRIDPHIPCHRVHHPRLDGMRRIIRPGSKTQMMASVLIAGIFEDVCLRKQAHDERHVLLVLEIV